MDIKFGTGGIRAVMGEGPGCLNIKMIQIITIGVSRYIKKNVKQPAVAICYDSRNNSEVFAKETASVLADCGCKVFLAKTLMPTPFLSFVTRKMKSDLGISITASHNGKEYNGYKVYGGDGCQITKDAAGNIQKEISRVSPAELMKMDSFENHIKNHKIIYIEENVMENFCDEVLSYSFKRGKGDDLKVVYSPLNGAGKECICNVLRKKGIRNLTLVEEQSEPDGNFPTCPYPNPEDDHAMALGIRLCEKMEADLFLATDPDGDRVGVAALRDGKYERLNGNQVGILLADYILRTRREQGSLPKHPVIYKTIVTTEMIKKIAEEYQAEVIDTLTGFKYIGEKLGELEDKGELHRFVFGVEESCGYLIGPYVRDKDGVGAAMMICEMAEEYKKQGKTLWDTLEELYERYGRYENISETRNFDSEDAKQYMDSLRQKLERGESPEEFDDRVIFYKDYEKGEENLPKADVLKIWFKSGSSMMIRPSGTEPKIKFYHEKVFAF